MILAHLRKSNDQKIIVRALENDKEIPIELMDSNQQRSYLNNAILLSSLGMGILIMAWTEVLPGIISVIPLSIAFGYFLIRYLNKRSS